MLRFYLDACVLNRLFDDRREERILREAIEVEGFFDLFRAGRVDWISSEEGGDSGEAGVRAA